MSRFSKVVFIIVTTDLNYTIFFIIACENEFSFAFFTSVKFIIDSAFQRNIIEIYVSHKTDLTPILFGVKSRFYHFKVLLLYSYRPFDFYFSAKTEYPTIENMARCNIYNRSKGI